MASKTIQTTFIITDRFIGAKTAAELFSELCIAKFTKNTWTRPERRDIMDSTTVKSDTCCSSFRR